MPPQAAPKAAASQAQASQPAAHDGTSLKDSYIPVFDGQPSSYQEWRKRIGIYHLKMKLQKRTAESILNIIGSLQGTAWKLVEGFDLDKIDKEGTFDDLMKLLDNAFRYDSRVRLPQDFDAYFSHLSRKPVRHCCHTSLSMTRSFEKFKNMEFKSLTKSKDGCCSRSPMSRRNRNR
jgi:hypothetical protein